MTQTDLEMAERLDKIKDEHKGKIAYLVPCMQLDCGEFVHTGIWYKWAGFMQTARLNYWRIPE